MQGDCRLMVRSLACGPHPPGSHARPSSLKGGPKERSDSVRATPWLARSPVLLKGGPIWGDWLAGSPVFPQGRTEELAWLKTRATRLAGQAGVEGLLCCFCFGALGICLLLRRLCVGPSLARFHLGVLDRLFTGWFQWSSLFKFA
jgi:hypothetical protein